MLILGMDTATAWGSMALLEDEEIILEVSLKAMKGGGEYLLAVLAMMTAKTGHKLNELQLIAVGTGPGSYTGIRVGLAAAKGLAVALGIPVVALSTLRILAENGRYAADWVAPMIDARRGEIYTALYQSTAEGLLPVIRPEAIAATAFREKVATLPAVLLCGDGGKNYPEVWNGASQLRIGPKAWDRPMAGLAGLLGQSDWRNGLAQHPELLLPSYLRRVEAEVRLEEKAHGNNN